jgi:hypothetical protein
MVKKRSKALPGTNVAVATRSSDRAMKRRIAMDIVFLMKLERKDQLMVQ